jgi:8-oxo-dGTP pyrophosphatase MutT (NUDIX family)
MKRKSFGIICARYNNNLHQIEFLLEKKRCTYAYIDFILGNYNINDNNRLIDLFNNMTISEKINILSLDFGVMWYYAWLVNPDKTFIGSSSIKCNFDVKKKIFINNFSENIGIIFNLIKSSKNIDTIWEFPKGRKNTRNESEIIAAIREFNEETGISKKNITILPKYGYFCDDFVHDGTNYFFKYYLAECSNVIEPNVNFFSSSQLIEIDQLKWIPFNHAIVLSKFDFSRIYKPLIWAKKILKKKHKIHKQWI